MFEKISKVFLTTLGIIFGIAWGIGGIAGAIYWVVKEDALNVFLSLIIPLYGAASVVIDLI